MKIFKDMESVFYKEVRQELLRGLLLLPKDNQRVFKLMYSKSITRSLKDITSRMPKDRLDWAMQQVQHTLDKKGLSDA